MVESERLVSYTKKHVFKFNHHKQDVLHTGYNAQLNLMNIAAEHINSLDYDDDLKERLKVSVQELYKRTLSPNYED